MKYLDKVKRINKKSKVLIMGAISLCLILLVLGVKYIGVINDSTTDSDVDIEELAESKEEEVYETNPLTIYVEDEKNDVLKEDSIENTEIEVDETVVDEMDAEETEVEEIEEAEESVGQAEANEEIEVDDNSSSSEPTQSFVADLSVAQQTTHVIVVDGNGGSSATLSVHKMVDGIWTQELSCSATVGKNGITSSKVEGDGKTPSGIYSLGQAFGVASNPGTTRSWLTLNSNYYWVDDSNSAYYNQLVDITSVTKDWTSAEHLIDYTTAYQYAIAINYNTSCTPWQGSAIFLHCSTSSGYTAGCVAVSSSNMVKILQSIQSDTLIYITN